jgi:hypothetical protein
MGFGIVFAPLLGLHFERLIGLQSKRWPEGKCTKSRTIRMSFYSCFMTYHQVALNVMVTCLK